MGGFRVLYWAPPNAGQNTSRHSFASFLAGKVRRDSGGGIGGWAYPTLLRHTEKTIQTAS